MNGIKREFGYPILRDGETTNVKDEEKVEMLAKIVLKLINQTKLVTLEQCKELIVMTDWRPKYKIPSADLLINSRQRQAESLNRKIKHYMSKPNQKQKLVEPGNRQGSYTYISNLRNNSKLRT